MKKLTIITNTILLIANISFLLNKKKKKKINSLSYLENIKNFPNINQYIINLMSHSFTEISKYLNNKYNNKNIFSNFSISFKKKKLIHFYAVDLYLGQEKDIMSYLKSCFKDKFVFRFNNKNPDYLIYNVFGKNKFNEKYNNCIKIACYSENSIPDFSNFDYAIGYSHISYLDRYFSRSFFHLRRLNKAKKLNLTEIRINAIKKPRKKFCAALISNPHLGEFDNFRLKFIEELNEYKKVDMGGNYKNNVGGYIKNKLEFLLDYKFSIAMENNFDF